jgi:hypothetical protein
MPRRRYAIEPNGEKRLEIEWKQVWKDLHLRLDGVEVGQAPDQKSLRAGLEFALPDGSTLGIKLVHRLTILELAITRNAQPLPGSDSDPAQRVKVAAGVACFIGVATTLIGGLAAAGVGILLQLGFGPAAVGEGLVFLILAYFINRRSLVALVLTIVLMVVDTIFSLATVVQSGVAPPISGYIVRVFLMIPLFLAVPALRTLRQPK